MWSKGRVEYLMEEVRVSLENENKKLFDFIFLVIWMAW